MYIQLYVYSYLVAFQSYTADIEKISISVVTSYNYVESGQIKESDRI